MTTLQENPAAQVALAKKAAATKAGGKKIGGTPAAIIDRDRKYRAKTALAAEANAKRDRVEVRAHAPRAPPSDEGDIRLLKKADVLRLTGVTYVTLWAWMRAGKFPRARFLPKSRGKGKSFWRSDEVERWLNELPVRRLKGDAA